MTRKTIHSIIGMPELTECLSSYLTTSDVAHAMATCKAWSHHFQPFLWTNLQTDKELPGRNTLKQNLHRIRTIDLDLGGNNLFSPFKHNAFDVLRALCQGLPITLAARSGEVVIDSDGKQAGEVRVALCTNLRRIKAVLCTSPVAPEDASWIYLAPLLRNNSNNLTHLYLDFFDITAPPVEQAFSALYRLHHLTICALRHKESWFLSLLRACLPLPRLSELYCHFSIESGAYTLKGDSESRCEGVDDFAEPRGELRTILKEAIAARTSGTGSMDFKIRALRFPHPIEGGDIINIILPMLRSALVEIETLEVPKLCYYRARGVYEEVARKYCPRLRHLIIPPYYAEDYPAEVDRAAVCSFIRGATGLKTFRGTDFSDGSSPTSSSIMSTLIAHHSKTLEELELLDCFRIASSDQQDVLASCKKLKRFWVTPECGHTSMYAFQFQDIVDLEWGCLGLNELCLTLNGSVHYKKAKAAMKRELSASKAQELSQERRKKEEKKHQVKAWAAKRVFMQIGRLVVLETLSLGSNESAYGRSEDRRVSEWDLTLSKGWLAELAGLKNLRHVHMRTDYWSRMGQGEVEFMDATWPLLGDHRFDLKKSEFHDLVKQPHWQWLQQKRPELRLSALHL